MASKFALFLAILVFTPSSGVEAAPDPNAAEYRLEDPAGDVFLAVAQGVDSPPLPPAAHTGYLDYTSFAIHDEDVLNLRLEISTTAGFEPYDGQHVVIGWSIYNTISFQVPRTDASPLFGVVSVTSYWDDTEPGSSRGIVSQADFCISEYPGDRFCRIDELELAASFDEGTLVLRVPKQALTRSGPFGPVYSRLPDMLLAGDALSAITVVSHSQAIGFVSVGNENPMELRDRIPNSGSAPPFALSFPSTASDLRIQLSHAGVVAGEENVVLVQLTNLADRKRLVNLDVTEHAVSGEWTFALAKDATIRAHDTVNLTLTITPPVLGSSGRPTADIAVTATVVTEGQTVAAAPVRFVASAALDAGDHTWYLHTTRAAGGLDVPLSHDILTFRSAWLSRLEVEPFASDDLGMPLEFTGAASGVDFSASVVAHDGIPNKVRLNGEPATAQIVIDTLYPMDVVLTSVIATADQVVATGSTAVPLQRGRTTASVEMAIQPNAERLAPKDTLRWDILLHRPGIEGIPLAFVGLADYPDVVARESWFDLPLSRERIIPPDPDLPDVSFALAEDADSFVNPGRTTVYEWTLRNDHGETVEIELAVDNLTRPWEHRVVPGTSFRLPPERSTRIGLLLSAPADAKEGEVCELRVLVREPGSGRTYAGSAVRAIVTRGVDVENETFEADASDNDLRITESATPGFSVLGAVGAAGLVFAVRRRRRPA